MKNLNYHNPACHNERVKALLKKFEIKLIKAHAVRNEIISVEATGKKLSSAEKARCSEMYLTIQDHVRTIEQLNKLTLPLEN